jgi:long-chain acyl-CoA synthetase
LHPDIAAAAIVGVPDADEGEVPVAFVALAPGHSVNSKELTEFLRTKLAHYKIPARFYVVEKLPLTRSGKIDHNALRAISMPSLIG